jgi:hypothetical protein
MNIAARAGVIAKASAREDFTVLQQASGSDADVERRIFDCLQLHLDSGGKMTSFLFRHESVKWLCRAEREPGTDAAGRGKSRCTFIRLPLDWNTEACMALLESTASNLEDVLAEDPRAVAPVATATARRALLGLLVTNEVPVVRSVSEAVWVSRMWGDDPNLEFMQSSASTPSRARFGRLLVIGAEDRFPLRELLDLESRLGQTDLPALDSLRRVQGLEQRQQLLHSWLNGSIPEGSGTSVEQREWHFRVGYERWRWLQTASSPERRHWLAQGWLKLEEIIALQEDWTAKDEQALANSLRICGADALQRYIAGVHPRAEQVLKLLEGREAEVFAALMNAQPLVEHSDLRGILASLEKTGALDTLDLPMLSVALRRHPELDQLRVQWVQAQERKGLPKSIALALMGGAANTVSPSEDPPFPPSAAWLVAVPRQALLDAVYWAVLNTAWKQWWVTAVALHPDCKGCVPSLEAAYSRETLIWLASEARDGLPRMDALKTLVSWMVLAGADRPSKPEVKYLLTAFGFAYASFWASVLDGSDSLEDHSVPETAEAEWELLCAAGLISLSQMVEAVMRGTSAKCLRKHLPEHGADLLRLGSGQVTQVTPYPPSEWWRNEFTPLLSIAARKPEFWNRWGENGAPSAMLDWLVVTLKDTQGGIYAAALQSAIVCGERLPCETLEVVAGGLGRSARLEQAALWAQDVQLPDVLRILQMLQARYPDLALEWLRARLTIRNFQSPLPANLNSRELLVLLPWLDPAEAVQAALSQRRGDAGETPLSDAPPIPGRLLAKGNDSMIWKQLAKSAGGDDFLLLDTLELSVKLVSCHLRPWFRDGIRVNIMADAAPNSFASLSLLIENSPLPLMVVTSHKDDTWADLSESLASSAFGARVIQVVRHGDQLAANGNWIHEEHHLDESGSTELTIGAANTRSLHSEMPCTIPFRMANPQSPANLMRISVQHPDPGRNAQLPSAIWLRIGGENVLQGALIIDLRPNPHGDTWLIHANSPQITVTPVAAPAPERIPALRNVAWVIDRTCPDWEQWSNALAMAMENHPEPEECVAFNTEIRRGIGSALQSGKWRIDTQMQVVWFGDTPGEEFSPLKGAPVASSAWGSAGDFLSVSDAVDAVNTLTYMPGYDVWDPLGEAMAQCVPWFQRRGSGTLLIIGNSPPRYTVQPPLRNISNALGFSTTYRESSDAWSRSLAALASMGVGVYYVFLKLGAHRIGEEASFSAFDTLQQVVRQQMALSLPGHLCEVPGTHDGVLRGIMEVLDQARTQLGRSSVEVLYAEL